MELWLMDPVTKYRAAALWAEASSSANTKRKKLKTPNSRAARLEQVRRYADDRRLAIQKNPLLNVVFLPLII